MRPARSRHSADSATICTPMWQPPCRTPPRPSTPAPPGNCWRAGPRGLRNYGEFGATRNARRRRALGLLNAGELTQKSGEDPEDLVDCLGNGDGGLSPDNGALGSPGWGRLGVVRLFRDRLV